MHQLLDAAGLHDASPVTQPFFPPSTSEIAATGVSAGRPNSVASHSSQSSLSAQTSEGTKSAASTQAELLPSSVFGISQSSKSPSHLAGTQFAETTYKTQPIPSGRRPTMCLVEDGPILVRVGDA